MTELAIGQSYYTNGGKVTIMDKRIEAGFVYYIGDNGIRYDGFGNVGEEFKAFSWRIIDEWKASITPIEKRRYKTRCGLSAYVSKRNYFSCYEGNIEREFASWREDGSSNLDCGFDLVELEND